MKKKCNFISCLLLCVVCCSGCFSQNVNKNEYKGFVPVSKEETEDSARQLAEAVNGGDKTRLFEAFTDINAVAAASIFAGDKVPDNLKSPSAQESEDWATHTAADNHTMFDPVERMEFFDIQQAGNTYGVRFKTKTKDGNEEISKNRYTFVKRKDDGKIILARSN